jgi:hypothetical protein
MKDQLRTLIDAAVSTGNTLRDKAASVGQAAVDNTIQTIEKWLEEFPKLEGYGLQITNFTFVMGLSPSLEIEMRGNHEDFTPERLAQILAENKASSLTGLIFNAVKTAYRLHAKVAKRHEDALLVKMKLSITPEVSVFIGKPRVN